MTIEKKRAFKEKLGKVGKAVWWALPEVLLFINIFILTILLLMGIAETAKEGTRSEMLAIENDYLKEEITWYKSLMADQNGVEIPTFPASAEDDSHE